MQGLRTPTLNFLIGVFGAQRAPHWHSRWQLNPSEWVFHIYGNRQVKLREKKKKKDHPVISNQCRLVCDFPSCQGNPWQMQAGSSIGKGARKRISACPLTQTHRLTPSGWVIAVERSKWRADEILARVADCGRERGMRFKPGRWHRGSSGDKRPLSWPVWWFNRLTGWGPKSFI